MTYRRFISKTIYKILNNNDYKYKLISLINNSDLKDIHKLAITDAYHKYNNKKINDYKYDEVSINISYYAPKIKIYKESFIKHPIYKYFSSSGLYLINEPFIINYFNINIININLNFRVNYIYKNIDNYLLDINNILLPLIMHFCSTSDKIINMNYYLYGNKLICEKENIFNKLKNYIENLKYFINPSNIIFINEINDTY